MALTSNDIAIECGVSLGWLVVVEGDIHEDLSISHHLSIQRRSVRLLMSTSQPAISK